MPVLWKTAKSKTSFFLPCFGSAGPFIKFPSGGLHCALLVWYWPWDTVSRGLCRQSWWQINGAHVVQCRYTRLFWQKTRETRETSLTIAVNVSSFHVTDRTLPKASSPTELFVRGCWGVVSYQGPLRGYVFPMCCVLLHSSWGPWMLGLLGRAH